MCSFGIVTAEKTYVLCVLQDMSAFLILVVSLQDSKSKVSTLLHRVPKQIEEELKISFLFVSKLETGNTTLIFFDEWIHVMEYKLLFVTNRALIYTWVAYSAFKVNGWYLILLNKTDVDLRWAFCLPRNHRI